MKYEINPKTEQPFAFVCFDDESDKSKGPEAANRAVTELHGREIVEGDKTYHFYVQKALKKVEREIEKKKDMLRYKNSKKRCNLYVKNFPANTSKAQLEELFGRYGKIESIKLLPEEGAALYAFVCFEKPENAFEAKVNLNQFLF